MKELYTNDLNVIDIYSSVRGVPTAPTGLPTATLYVSSSKDFPSTGTTLAVAQVEDEDSEPVVGRYQVSVPSSLVQKKRYARVDVAYTLPTFGSVTTSDIYEIGQRLVGFEELNTYLGVDVSGESYALDWNQYDKLESVVRRIIETYCGQKFNCWQGSRKVYSARDYIQLPQHLEKLDSITSAGVINPVIYQTDMLYEIEEGGLSLDRSTDFQTPSFLDIRSKNNMTHVITGLWGYEGIPADVNQAAYEVIELFNTDDVDARRKFLSYITNDASVNMNFNWTSYWDSTGNPIADDLLDPYRIYNLNAV